MELDRNYSLAQESLKIAEEKLTSLKYWLTGLSAFILVMLTALVALFRRQARIKDSRKASTVIPAVNDPSPGGGMPNTEAPVEAPKPPEISLAERIQPLMEVDIQMAACYTMLSVDVSVIKISKALKCSRKQVYDFIERIGRIYGIEKDDVRADALKYGKSRNDNPKAKS